MTDDRKTFREVADDVYDLIEKIMDAAGNNADDCGSLMSVMLKYSLDPKTGAIQGVVRDELDSGRAMRNSFIAFCLALLHTGTSVAAIKSALKEAVTLYE